MVNSIVKYEVVAHFLAKQQRMHRRSQSVGRIVGSKSDQQQQQSSSSFRRTTASYTRCCGWRGIIRRKTQRIHEWMRYFIKLDPRITWQASCAQGSRPLLDAMSLDSGMVESIMAACQAELFTVYSLHAFIDVACCNPKLERRMLQWMRICLERHEARLLTKRVEDVTPLQYAQRHPRYYCSQIILFLKRKHRTQQREAAPQMCKVKKDDASDVDNFAGSVNDDHSPDERSVLDRLQRQMGVLERENAHLKRDNLEWRHKYYQLLGRFERVSREPSHSYPAHTKVSRSKHHYPTPNGIGKEKKDEDNKAQPELERAGRRRNAFASKDYVDWSSDDVVDWLMSQSETYQRYESRLRENVRKENIRGKHLAMLQREDLGRLGVDDFGDKYDMLQHIRALAREHHRKAQPDGPGLSEGVGGDVEGVDETE